MQSGARTRRLIGELTVSLRCMRTRKLGCLRATCLLILCFWKLSDDMLDCDVTSALLEDACPARRPHGSSGCLATATAEWFCSIIVECFADEAVGLALAANVDVLTERSLLEVFSRTGSV